jgi:hypothetical protein
MLRDRDFELVAAGTYKFIKIWNKSQDGPDISLRVLVEQLYSFSKTRLGIL